MKQAGKIKKAGELLLAGESPADIHRFIGCARSTVTAAAKKLGLSFLKRTPGRNANGGISPEYRAWYNMKSRTLNSNRSDFKYYGGRGIIVCERWKTFPNFLADMGKRPPGTTIDRIDNDGHYEPGNCRWVTRAIQRRNNRQLVLITWHGETKCAEDWSAQCGIPAQLLRYRIHAGWSAEKAITTPSKSNH